MESRSLFDFICQLRSDQRFVLARSEKTNVKEGLLIGEKRLYEVSQNQIEKDDDSFLPRIFKVMADHLSQKEMMPESAKTIISAYSTLHGRFTKARNELNKKNFFVRNFLILKSYLTVGKSLDSSFQKLKSSFISAYRNQIHEINPILFLINQMNEAPEAEKDFYYSVIEDFIENPIKDTTYALPERVADVIIEAVNNNTFEEPQNIRLFELAYRASYYHIRTKEAVWKTFLKLGVEQEQIKLLNTMRGKGIPRIYLKKTSDRDRNLLHLAVINQKPQSVKWLKKTDKDLYNDFKRHTDLDKKTPGKYIQELKNPTVEIEINRIWE